MKNKIVTYSYQGQPIAFEFTAGNQMINATQMAKGFGKRIPNFLRLKETKVYIDLLSKRFPTKQEVIRTVRGGTPEVQGTWMERRLALKFASWLSPEFELWVYDRIEELIRTGQTSLHQEQSGIVRGLRMIVDKLEEQEAFNVTIKAEIVTVSDRLSELEAKVTSSDEDYYSIAGFCSLHGVACPLHKAKEWGRQCVSLSMQHNVEMGDTHDPR